MGTPQKGFCEKDGSGGKNCLVLPKFIFFRSTEKHKAAGAAKLEEGWTREVP